MWIPPPYGQPIHYGPLPARSTLHSPPQKELHPPTCSPVAQQFLQNARKIYRHCEWPR